MAQPIPNKRGYWKTKNFNLESRHILALKAYRLKIGAKSDSQALRHLLNQIHV